MTDKSKQADPKATPKAKVKALRIRSIAPQGHRRAGRRWPAQGTVVPVAALGAGQLKALRADGRLVVEETEVEAAGEAGADA